MLPKYSGQETPEQTLRWPLSTCLALILLGCLPSPPASVHSSSSASRWDSQSHYTHHTSYTLQAQTTDSDTPDGPEFEFQLCHLGQYKLRQIPSSFRFRFRICKVKIMILLTTDSCSDNQMRQCKQEKFMAKC